MALPNASKTRNFFANFLTFWIPIKIYRVCLRNIIKIGVFNYIKTIKAEKTTKFPTTLAIGAIMKNEGPYLKEWLDYHILVGVEKFYLYDNESTDNTTEILKPYIKKGIVEYNYIEGKSKQYTAYVDILKKHSWDTKWIALIDLDEFIVPVQHKTIPEFLSTLPKNCSNLVMTWVLYGSSGHETKPDGLVMENYKNHRKKTSGVKSIINPRFVSEIKIHVCTVAGFIMDENGKKLGRIDQTNNPPTISKIRVNHYVTKSREEFEKRVKRGGGCNGPDSKSYQEKAKKFDWYNTDTVYDNIMDKYIAKLKK